MTAFPSNPDDTGSAYDAVASDLDEARPHPTSAALSQLGHALMSELLDVILETALEDFSPAICETLIGGLHAGVQRIEREADRARDGLARQLRDFDGSEVADDALQALKRKVDAADIAVGALEAVRDSAAETYSQATGEVWSPWRGAVRAGVTAAQMDAKAALRAVEARRKAAADPGDCVVAFRASPQATSPEDASRIFDALNWAHTQWPSMSLALTDAPGGDRLAKRWAQQKRVPIVLARPDFEQHGRAAPFRANDQLMALTPVCALVLTASVLADTPTAFGPALNLAELAVAAGVRCVRIRARPPAP